MQLCDAKSDECTVHRSRILAQLVSLLASRKACESAQKFASVLCFCQGVFGKKIKDTGLKIFLRDLAGQLTNTPWEYSAKKGKYYIIIYIIN